MSTFYFVRQVGQEQPLKPGLTVEYCTEPEQAIEMARSLNQAESMRHKPGPMVEPVRIEVTPLKRGK